MDPTFFANTSLWGGTSTGIFFIDFFCRPILRFGFKHPAVLVTVITGIYSYIAYLTLKSAYFEELS